MSKSTAVARWRGLASFALDISGSADSCPRARGLALGYTLLPAGAGLRRLLDPIRGLADSPWATRCCPLARAYVACSIQSQGSRTLPGLHAVARWRGLVSIAGLCRSRACVDRGLASIARLRPPRACSIARYQDFFSG